MKLQSKEKSAEILNKITLPICQGILYNYLTDEEEALGKRDVLLQNDGWSS